MISYIIQIMDSQIFYNKNSNILSKSKGGRMVSEKSKKIFNQIKFCRPYPIQTALSYRIILLFLYFVFLVNIILAFKFSVADSTLLGINIQFLKLYFEPQSYYYFGIVFIIKLTVLSNITLQLMIGDQRQHFKILFSTMQKLKKNQRIFVEMDIQISFTLLFTQSITSIANFLISVIIILFSLVFLENYYDQKDRFYIGNFYYLTAFRLTIIIGAILNTLLSFIGSIPAISMIYHTCASTLIMLFYLFGGWTTYRDSLLRWGHLIFLSLYFTISINLLVYYYCIPKNGSFLIHSIFTFSAVFFFLELRLNRQEEDSIKPSSKIEHQYFSIFSFIQSSYDEIQTKGIVSGLLKSHSVSQCGNIKCYCLLDNVYDSKKIKLCENKDFINERVSLSKFYLQCKFQTYIEYHPINIRVLLIYCELLYWKFRNISKTIYWLEFIKTNITQMSLSSLIKYNGLLDIVKKDNQNFSHLLYNQSLDIEHLIEAEDIYQNITFNIAVTLNERLQTWKLIEKQQIDLSCIRQKIEPTFASILSIQQDWKKIRKHLKHCKKWKQQYLFFILYLKNMKMKYKVLQEFESTQNNIGKYGKQINLQPKSLFTKDTCCLSIYLKNCKALIKRVSNNFAILTGYSSEQVIDASINILLTSFSKTYHETVIEILHKEGKFIDESIYKLNQVYLVNKQGFIIPVLKIFKEFVNQAGELEYICFLKAIEKKQVTILCDQYFQIQNFTFNFVESLDITSNVSKRLINLNFLSMAPRLKSISLFSSMNEKAIQKEILEKVWTNNQEMFVQIQFSKYFQDRYFQAYKDQVQQLNKQNIKKYLNLIECLQSKISEECLKIKISILVNCITNQYSKYYEIKINQADLKKQIKRININKNGNQAVMQQFGGASFVQSCKYIPLKFNKKDRIMEINGEPLLVNIFIKQEDNQVPQDNGYLKSFRYMWLFFLCLLMISMNSSLIGLSSKFRQIQDFSLKMQSVLQINSLSSNILAYYQSYLLNATSFTYIKPKVKSFTASLQTAFKNKNYQQLIFDKKVNSAGIYYPITSFLQQGNFSYNQVDLIFLIQSLFESLAIQNNLTTKSYSYQLLTNYYYPSFIKLTNNTKSNLHQSFQDHIQGIINLQTITYSIESLIFLAIILTTIYFSIKFFKSMLEMVKLHCQFHSRDIKTIIKYYQKTIEMLNKIQNTLSTKQEPCSNLSNLTIEMQQARSNDNLNNRSRQIIIGKKQIKQYIIYVIKVLVCIFLLVGFRFWSIYYLNSLVQPIVNVQAYGFKQFLYNPNRIITSFIISNQYIYPTQFAPKIIYKEIMSNSFIQSNIPYIAEPILNTKFYTYVQNVYFTNLCRLFQSTLKKNNFALTQCETIAASSFTRGTVSYSGFQYNKIDRIFTFNQSLSAQQIKEFYRSMQFSRLFFSNLVSIWQQQIFSLCEQSLWVIQALLVTLNLILVGVIAFSFLRMFNYLQKEYKYYKQFYQNMMPQFIVSSEKIIKSKLVVTSFL